MNWLRQVWRSRYVGMLEDENARLKAENRAFLNSLLGTAGFRQWIFRNLAGRPNLHDCEKGRGHRYSGSGKQRPARSERRIVPYTTTFV